LDETDLTLTALTGAAPVPSRPELTRAVSLGAARLMRDLGFSVLHEVALPSGRRADLMGLDAAGRFVICEVKSSIEDYRSDAKWQDYRPWCDMFGFAVPVDFPQDALPPDVGLIVADQFGGAVLRELGGDRLAPARRKALTIGFGRLAAARLHWRSRGLEEPAPGEGPVI
jgi:hypothetical protein